MSCFWLHVTMIRVSVAVWLKVGDDERYGSECGLCAMQVVQGTQAGERKDVARLNTSQI